MTVVATITPDARGRAVIEKDPAAVLDYSWDWTEWLEANTPGDQIATIEVTGDGVTIDSSDHDGFIVTAWISGGEAYVDATAVCHIVTVGGREEDRTIYLKVRDR